MTQTRILYLMLTAAALFWLWRHFSGGEEAQIRRRLGQIEALVEKASGEGALDGVARARSFAEIFSEPFAAEVLPAGARIGDKAQLMQAFVGFRHASEKVSLDYRGLAITLGPGRKEALATFDAVLNGGPGGILADESYKVELRWRQTGGEWRIAEAKVGEAVSRGGR